MIHWESFEAVHYRGIDGLSLSNLGHANLITGANGAGKTALIEAMWLLTGRHNPVLLWNQNVQRSALPVTNPISVLSDDLLELHGREGRERRTWKAVYRPVTQGHADPAAHGMMETNGENKPMPIPLAGRIDTWIDGTPVKETQSTSTPNGVVLVGGAKPGKTHAMIEGTRGQLEIPDEYLQRYSDLVREGRKEDLTRAISLILPRIKGLEILTDESGKSYVSRKYIQWRSTTAPGPWGWSSAAVQAVLEFRHRPRRYGARGRDRERHSPFRAARPLGSGTHVDSGMEGAVRGNDP